MRPLSTHVSSEARRRQLQGLALTQPFESGASADCGCARLSGVFSPAWTARRLHRSLPSTATGLSAQGQWIGLNSKGLWLPPIPPRPFSNQPPIPSSTLSHHSLWPSSVFQRETYFHRLSKREGDGNGGWAPWKNTWQLLYCFPAAAAKGTHPPVSLILSEAQAVVPTGPVG